MLFCLCIRGHVEVSMARSARHGIHLPRVPLLGVGIGWLINLNASQHEFWSEMKGLLLNEHY